MHGKGYVPTWLPSFFPPLQASSLSQKRRKIVGSRASIGYCSVLLSEWNCNSRLFGSLDYHVSGFSTCPMFVYTVRDPNASSEIKYGKRKYTQFGAIHISISRQVHFTQLPGLSLRRICLFVTNFVIKIPSLGPQTEATQNPLLWNDFFSLRVHGGPLKVINVTAKCPRATMGKTYQISTFVSLPFICLQSKQKNVPSKNRQKKPRG